MARRLEKTVPVWEGRKDVEVTHAVGKGPPAGEDATEKWGAEVDQFIREQGEALDDRLAMLKEKHGVLMQERKMLEWQLEMLRQQLVAVEKLIARVE